MNLRYRELLSIEGISFLSEPDSNFFSNHWLTVIQVESTAAGFNRETIRQELLRYNIESRPTWKPMHMQPLYKDYPFYGNGTSEMFFENGLCLPSGSNMTDQEFDRIEGCIKNLLSSR